jgi:hypothetical protein
MKWTNEAHVKEIIGLAESFETYVLLDMGKAGPFLVFEPHFAVPYNPNYTGNYKDLAPYKKGDIIRFKLYVFSLVKETTEHKTRIEFEGAYGHQQIKEVVGKVVDVIQYKGENDVILDINGIYIGAMDRMKERAKIGDYVYCKFNGPTHIQNVEKLITGKNTGRR